MDDPPFKTHLEKFVSPLRKETLAASVAAQLKSLMFRKELKTGDRLPPERELAKLFNVSRVVIKQALLALEHSGFVEIKLGSKGGAFVIYDFTKPITVFMEDLQKNGDLRIFHFQDVRRALECLALKLTLERQEVADLSKLITINQEFADPKSRARHSELNIAFHLALAELSGNPLIKILLASLMEMVFSYPGPTISAKFIKKASQEHEQLIEAIGNRDKELATKLLTQNIDLVSKTDI